MQPTAQAWRRARRCRLPTAALLGALALLGAARAQARPVTFPMHLDYAFIRRLVVEEMFTGPGESSQVWQDESRCNNVVLSEPRFAGLGGKLHMTAMFNAKLGAGVGNWCLNVSDWSGKLDATLEPQLHATLPIVTFRVIDSNMYAADGGKHLTGTMWDWVKSRVHPRLETIRIDLYQPITELKMFVPMLFPGGDLGRTQRLLDSISLTDVAVGESAVSLRVALDVPEPVSPPPASAVPEPTLTVEEVEQWDRSWQSWDGFLTFLIKHSSAEASEELRHELREVFLEARYDIVAILRSAEPRAAEPVRGLFLKTWKRLAPIMRQLTTSLPGETSLRYMSFITAADALSALEQLGPEYGIEITSDGLRRMARMIVPAPFGDPVSYGETVDPELRRLFGFGPAPPTPELSEEDVPAEDAPAVEPTPEPPATTPDGGHARGPAGHRPEATAAGIWRAATRWFVAPAFAAPVIVPAERKLEHWIPTRNDVLDYLPHVAKVLRETAASTRAEKKLAEKHSTLFHDMMLTTAWQESCWRQMIKKNGKLQPLTSSVGAVGIMQVNVRVWRGFYDQNALRNSLQYNAKAGSEILQHYLVDYAIAKGELNVRNDPDDLARATYAAYNGGPGKLRRYRQQAGKAGHHIDAAFWRKYQEIKAGHTMAVASCFGVTFKS